MKSIEILMSTYNGGNVVERQIRSIMEQKHVDVFLTIRDDGSTDDTYQIIENLIDEYKDRIRCVKGDNIGWKKSFIELIELANEADFYGFADQDDFWFPNKLSQSINLIDCDDDKNEIRLVHVNSLCTDSNLKVLKEQQKKYAMPRNRRSVIAQEYFQGCSMVWNKYAMITLKKYKPIEELAHDYWVGTVCYYLGKIYYCDEPLFYHIRYESNSSTDGNVMAGRKKRLAKIINKKTVYMNPAKDIIDGYSELLQKDDYKFLTEIINSKHNYKSRLKLFFMKDFRRETILSTILFKIILLKGDY